MASNIGSVYVSIGVRGTRALDLINEEEELATELADDLPWHPTMRRVAELMAELKDEIQVFPNEPTR